MESFKISSDVFPCVSVGMYDSILSPTNHEQDVMQQECDDYHPFNYVSIDVDDWKSDILDFSRTWMEKEVIPIMNKYGVDHIRVDNIHSPKYYNFHTDELYVTVFMQDDWRSLMHNYLAAFKQSKEFQKYIDEHFCSHDGFSSLMPKSFDEIEAFNDDQRCLGAYLTLCLLNEGEINMPERFEEDCYEYLCQHSGAAPLQSYLETSEIDSFDADELQDLYLNDDRFSEIYWGIYHNKGHLWRSSDYDSMGGQNNMTAQNDGMRFIFWAAKNGYTVDDLKAMAA